MQVIHPRCAGLDVHKDTVVACVRLCTDTVAHHVQSFGTTTDQLYALCEWLSGHQITHVAMEATGVYWKPVWHVLESDFALVLANAQHIKAVPGRKTDVNDATWIADLLAHGLVAASFVPPTPIQDLRTMVRTRKQLVRERVQHVQRIQKTLEDANLKIASVLSDITGQSGRAILEAIIAGQHKPRVLASLVSSRVRADQGTLMAALRGTIRPVHRTMLRIHLSHIDALERTIAELDKEASELLTPFSQMVAHLVTMPGISEVTAHAIVAEIGTDMSRFPDAGHLLSWACLCPRNDESAGKRRSRRLRPGGNWLKTALVQAAWAAVRKKTGYLRAQFHRLKTRGGPKKAIIAVAASMLRSAYHMLRDGSDFHDLGSDYFLRHDEKKTLDRLVRKIHSLGYTATLAPNLDSPGAVSF